MKLMNEMLAGLHTLRAALIQDLMYCTTRDQHIRLAQRIAALDLIISSSSELDTPVTYDTVVT